jgi:replicative DNA helicase
VATEQVSAGSLLRALLVSSSRARAASLAGTSTTCSPAATSSWAIPRPRPLAPPPPSAAVARRPPRPACNSSPAQNVGSDGCPGLLALFRDPAAGFCKDASAKLREHPAVLGLLKLGKGHAGDLLKVDRRGRPPEYVERPCLTIGLAVQPEVLRGLAGRPGFGGRGLLARFLYSLPPSLVGHRQVGTPPVAPAVADRYALELQALAASLSIPAGPADDDGPAVLVLDQEAAELLLAFERDLEPHLAAASGDLAHLAGWAAKLAGATCRLAALLHLAGHPRDGWARPISGDTFADAIRLAGYLVEHARAVFDLMGADPRIEDARWLLDWITRTGQAQFTRRDAHRAAPRGRFSKASDLDPTLGLLEEHGWLRRVDADASGPKGGRPPSPRFLVNPLHPSTEPPEPTQPPSPTGSVSSVSSVTRGDTSESPR